MAVGELSVRAAVSHDDEIGQLGASFNLMAGRIDEPITSLRRFVADAAHEIGTPLTALQADLELVDLHAESPDEKRLIGRALQQADRLGDLASDLLRLSRLEAMDALSGPEGIDLGALSRQLADAVASRADQAGIELVVDLPAGPVPVSANLERLRTAIEYLLDNALKFTPAGGSVTIGLRADHAAPGRPAAVISVSDTGIGIPADDLPGLFERFHRARNATGYQGSGLGLAIVKATAEVHGGSVRAESSGIGSRFEMRLPLASA
jgi:signal transduction histidine kinase